ncbi:MAG: HU family DNA-binding protein [Deltaproteobacteria bacterium]|jgi:DNA-binding protein HU-beta|nr:HU family DNA-binding protein [Deltaproteobacteria bacterium]
MTKAELVAKIATEAKLTQAQSSRALNSLIESLASEIHDAGTMTLSGLGTFTVVSRAARSGVNPRTKEVINIPATNTVRFRCAKALKDLVNS